MRVSRVRVSGVLVQLQFEHLQAQVQAQGQVSLFGEGSRQRFALSGEVVAHAVRVVDGKSLREDAAGRIAEHVDAVDAEMIEQFDRVAAEAIESKRQVIRRYGRGAVAA